jgi:hypothetical protein
MPQPLQALRRLAAGLVTGVLRVLPPTHAAEVVDIEAREVPEPAPRPLPKG